LNLNLNVRAIVGCLHRCPKSSRRSSDLSPGKHDPRPHSSKAQHRVVEQSIAADRDPVDLRIGGRGLRDVYGRWAPILYCNSYVGVGQMGGHESFRDPRIGLTTTQVAASPRSCRALLDYQLSLLTPDPPRGSLDREAATREACISATRVDAPPATGPEPHRRPEREELAPFELAKSSATGPPHHTQRSVS
jgi:hypothetical protein